MVQTKLKCGINKGSVNNAPRSKKITAHYLLNVVGACGRQVDLFKELFPKEMELTRENLIKASLGGMSMRWVKSRILSDEAFKNISGRFKKVERRCCLRSNRAYARFHGSEISENKLSELVQKARKDLYTDQANLIADALGLK
jgi:hypothetical protein